MEYRTVRVAPKIPGGDAAVGLDRDAVLSPAEIRVLGCLVEKESTTPDYYPLTLNALVAACNQKSSRDPVVSYSESDVVEALNLLKDKGLARRITSSDARVPRFRHVFREALAVDRAQAAALCVLMLRGPQTAGEIRQRTGRIHEFESPAEVEETLEGLAARQTRALAVKLPRRPGTKESRYAHLLSGEAPEFEVEAELAPRAPASSRIAELEAELAALRLEVDSLRAEFTSFKQQF